MSALVYAPAALRKSPARKKPLPSSFNAAMASGRGGMFSVDAIAPGSLTEGAKKASNVGEKETRQKGTNRVLRTAKIVDVCDCLLCQKNQA